MTTKGKVYLRRVQKLGCIYLWTWIQNCSQGARDARNLTSTALRWCVRIHSRIPLFVYRLPSFAGRHALESSWDC
jgi:hypothetical protein